LSVEDFENEKTLTLLESLLKDSAIASRVVLEITESEQIKNFELVKEIVAKFKGYGCQIAIDDFGSGYSNFNYLMKLQADFIKIDGSLIKDLDTDFASKSIVKAIVSFAKEMNIKTIAEYVHSEEIYQEVLKLDIDYSQGYYFGIPNNHLI
jgi:EAL domain-containing protein (putative c-di-GMP-specific phosphodiesterase class I)